MDRKLLSITISSTTDSSLWQHANPSIKDMVLPHLKARWQRTFCCLFQFDFLHQLPVKGHFIQMTGNWNYSTKHHKLYVYSCFLLVGCTEMEKQLVSRCFTNRHFEGQNKILYSNKKKNIADCLSSWLKKRFFPLTAVARTGRLKQLDTDFSQDTPCKND